jgi:hypothetical protein
MLQIELALAQADLAWAAARGRIHLWIRDEGEGLPADFLPAQPPGSGHVRQGVFAADE